MRKGKYYHFVISGLIIFLFLGGAALINAGFHTFGIISIGVSLLILLVSIYIESQAALREIERQDDIRGLLLFSLKTCVFDTQAAFLKCYENGFVMTDGSYELSDFMMFDQMPFMEKQGSGYKIGYLNGRSMKEHSLTITDNEEEDRFISWCIEKNVEVQTDGKIW